MRILLCILGTTLATVGVLNLAIALMFLNTRFQIVRIHWGVFDPEINGTALSDTAAVAAFGIVGVALLVLGYALFRGPRRTAA